MVKLLVLSIFLAIALNAVLSKPILPKTDQELSRSFVEFLHQDKQLAQLLEKSNFEEAPIRNKRDAEADVDDDGTTIETAQSAGFFDRAAKFVMEILQRFLKWINTDD